jgi:pimeloyl-ACP methyl ester carboxylesterase
MILMKRRHAVLLSLLLLCLLPARRTPAQVLVPSTDVVRFQIWGGDSLALFGSYFGARASDDDRPGLIVLHDRGAQGRDFAVMARDLQDAGITVILPDLRGEGESLRTRGRSMQPPPSWDAPWRSLMAEDVAALLRFADHQPSLTGRPWLLLAEGEAASLALELMAGNSRYRGAILLSPLPAPDQDPAVAELEGRVLMFCCDQDQERVEVLRRLFQLLPPESRRMELLPCRSRGSYMIKWVSDLTDRIRAWILADS